VLIRALERNPLIPHDVRAALLALAALEITHGEAIESLLVEQKTDALVVGALVSRVSALEINSRKESAT
jgi:hypothetical protein